MSTSTQEIPFFTNDICIAVHSSSNTHHVGNNVMLDTFANGHPLRLEVVIESGELIAHRNDGAFIQGAEKT